MIRYLVIAGAALLSVLMWIDRACISAAKSDIAGDLGLTDTQVGWVMGAFTLGYAFFQVPGGKLADRFGPRLAMTLVCVLWSLFTMLTGVVRSYGPMLGVRFLFGVGEAGGYPTITRAFANWLPIGERGIANSISFSGGRLGAALAMPLVVWLIDAVDGWQNAFLTFGLVGLVVAAVWFLLFRDRPETHFAVSEAEAAHIVATRTAAPASMEEAAPQADASPLPLAALASPTMLMLMLQYVAHNFTFFFVVSWFFPYFKERYDLTPEQAALYTAAPLLCGVVGNWLSGATVDALYRRGRWRLSRRLPAAVGFTLAAIGMSLCVSMTDPQLAVACMCLAIFGSDMVLSPSWSTCMDIGGASVGTVSGAMNMIGNLGSFAVTLAFPVMVARFGSHVPFFYLAAALNLVSIGLWFLIRPDRPLAAPAIASDD